MVIPQGILIGTSSYHRDQWEFRPVTILVVSLTLTGKPRQDVHYNHDGYI